MANQHTSALVGVEKPWAEAVAAGLDPEVETTLTDHAAPAMRRTMMAWLQHGARYDYASPASVMRWRRILVAAGEPPRAPVRRRSVKPPIMYLGSRRAAA